MSLFDKIFKKNIGERETYAYFKYQNNPVLKWCLGNTIAKSDVNGNIQPVKKIDRRMRIDGSIAMICAYKVFQDKQGEYINLNEEL